jgi:hypothetical protein
VNKIGAIFFARGAALHLASYKTRSDFNNLDERLNNTQC